jgi:hypothetical protein
MAVAPLIKPIQTQKGMFYTFQSSLEDLTLTFNNNSNQFRFSKFALLRIPDIGLPGTIEKDNRVQFLAPGESPMAQGISLANANLNLAQSFQNYALNFESLIISQEAYQRDLKLNVSERVFWKWMKELGAIRWRSASVSEVANLAAGELRWAEDWANGTSATSYSNEDRVVQYLGDIDVVNSVRSKDNSYSELYIHVPTTAGSSPTALFKSIADDNYHPDMLIVNSPADPLNIEYLNGRRYNETHPATSFGMDLRAYYDLDDNSVDTYISDTLTSTPSIEGFWWGANSTLNCYHTDLAAYYGARSGTDTSPTSAIKTQRVKKLTIDRSVEYLRSTFDGAVVDFTLSDYLLAQQNSNIKSLAQLNDSVGNYDFGFNAILVYYDVYDPANPDDVATNLYGIYFLNKIVQTGTDFAIPLITKEKPNAITKTNGNAFAFKVNLKFDTSIEEVTVERSINDYSTFGLELFVDVLTEIRKLQTKFNEKIAELENLAIDVDAAKQALTNTSGLDSLARRISQLESTVSASTAAFNETAAIMLLIQDLNAQIDDLYNNRTSLQLSYNLDAFREGYGIKLDKLTPGALTLASSAQAYSDVTRLDFSSPSVNSGNIITLPLGISNTYYKHSRPTTWTVSANQVIRINDAQHGWKKGKKLRLVIDTAISPSTSYYFTIKTDAKNASNQTSTYGKVITTLTQADFLTTFGRTQRPIIEITCTDPVNFTFEVDKIIR